MQKFNYGAFNIEQTSPSTYDLLYGSTVIASQNFPSAKIKRWEIAQAFERPITAFINGKRAVGSMGNPFKVELVDLRHNNVVLDSFDSYLPIPDMTGAIHDNSEHDLWATSPLGDKPITQEGFEWLKKEQATISAQVKAMRQGMPKAWICAMLPHNSLTLNHELWVPPSPWHIRHVVGEGSFTGVTGIRAAAISGISAQHFRKFMAQPTSINCQAIPFAAWHLLLQRLGVQSILPLEPL